MNITALMQIAAGTLLLATPAMAEQSEGRAMAELAFESIDGAERGFIDQGEFTNFGNDIFVSMDSDDSEKLSLSEFTSWGFGWDLVAEEAGRLASYETALRVVFAFWDLNGDGEISKTEHRKAMQTDFARADSNNDAVLTTEEFLTGYSVNVAVRSAINPSSIK